MVVSFNTQLINQVNFRLPRLRMSGKLTILMPRRTLNCWMACDANSGKAGYSRHYLNGKNVDYEVEVERYNKSAKRASLPNLPR